MTCVLCYKSSKDNRFFNRLQMLFAKNLTLCHSSQTSFTLKSSGDKNLYLGLQKSSHSGHCLRSSFDEERKSWVWNDDKFSFLSVPLRGSGLELVFYHTSRIISKINFCVSRLYKLKVKTYLTS